MEISIHSPLAGRDVFRRAVRILRILFQSTRPSRGETIRSVNGGVDYLISIHSPLAGRDAG